MKKSIGVVVVVMMIGLVSSVWALEPFSFCPDCICQVECPQPQNRCICECNSFSELEGYFKVNIKGQIHCGTIVTNGEAFLLIDGKERVYFAIDKPRMMKRYDDLESCFASLE